MQLKLRKIGNSVGVVLPKDVLAHLQAGEGDEVELVKGTEGRLMISADKPEIREQMRVARDLMQRYRNTLRELAK